MCPRSRFSCLRLPNVFRGLALTIHFQSLALQAADPPVGILSSKANKQIEGVVPILRRGTPFMVRREHRREQEILEADLYSIQSQQRGNLSPMSDFVENDVNEDFAGCQRDRVAGNVVLLENIKFVRREL